MTNSDLQKLRYPIGEYVLNPDPSADEIKKFIDTIESFPERLSKAVKDLNDEQLDTPYREGGWTIRQVVHHVADSHINGYCRFKFALTENTPAVKAYDETLWAELPEAKSAPIELSLPLLEALHKRWVVMLRAITPAGLKRKIYHSGNKTEMSVDELLGLYSWHSDHHLAHITETIKRMNW